MTTLKIALLQIWRRLYFRWRRVQLDQDLAEELADHLSRKQEEALQQGMAQYAAEGTGRRAMGNMTVAKEDCRDMWSFMSWERFWQDLHHAIRMYGRTPVFTFIAVSSLALGIGANAAMFSLVNTLLIRPLPYAQPERLLRITGIYPRAALPFFQSASRSVEFAAVSSGSDFNLTGAGAASRIRGSKASPNFLSVLGVAVAHGRAFSSGEDLPGRDAVALISDRLWKERFSRDPSLVGRTVTLDGVNRQIVGIMPANFSYPSAAIQVWTPMRLEPANFLEYWGTEFMPFIGRLRPGATLNEAHAELTAMITAFRKTFPYPMARNWNADAAPILLQQDVIGDVRPKLLILLCSVGIVLLIACTNVAGLLLSRASTRRREIALRAALGAGRWRIIRQLLTESVGLAAMGSLAGVFLAMGVLSAFKSVLPASMPGLAQAQIDWTVIGAVAILAVGSGVSFGLAPAISTSQVDLTEAIKSGGQRSTASFWARFRSLVIVSEIALTLILVVSAGLLLRSLYKLSNADPGFDTAGITTLRISPNQSFCEQRASCVSFYDRLTERVSRVGGVTSVAIANTLPLDGDVPAIPVEVEGHPKTPDHPAPMLWLGAVSPDYFRLMRIRLLSGRYFDRQDGADSARVVMVSASTAKHFWAGENPIGKHIKPTGLKQWSTVVGLLADVRQYSLGQALPQWMEGALYMPYPQSIKEDERIPAAMTLLVKSSSVQTSQWDELHRVAEAQDPNVPVGHVQTLDQVVSASIASFRSTMRVFVAFAAAAMILAAIGIYGLMSYWVNARTYEIGLRVAIGATRWRIMSMIVQQGLKVALGGIASGVAVAFVLTRFMTDLLYGVGATDPLTFGAVAILILFIATLATGIPAVRAARINPVKSLRAD